MASLFDILAEVISMVKRLPGDGPPADLSQESEDAISGEVRQFLSSLEEELTDAAAKGLTSSASSAIMEWCRRHNDHHHLRFLLCTLDADGTLGWEAMLGQERYDGFESLNDNRDSTGILILPRVERPYTTYPADETGRKGDARETAHKQINSLNNALNHFYYVCRDELMGFKPRNFVVNHALDYLSPDTLRVGVAPLLNRPYKDVLAYNDTIRRQDKSGCELLYMSDIRVRDQKEIIRRFERSFYTACSNGTHILIYPEMLGVKAFYREDSCHFNPMIRRLSKAAGRQSVPELILVPSMWEDRKNYVSVYLPSGRRLCTQYKQHPYQGSPGSAGKCTELLEGMPQEINLIHMSGWGTIAIPICMDYLQHDYRHLLVASLKANILLCPSFSLGEYDFLQRLDSHAAFGVYTVWLNSCSALADKPGQVPELVGGVSVPAVSTHSRIERLVPLCSGGCSNGCLFIVKIPLDCVGTGHFEGALAEAQHIEIAG